MSRRFKIAGGVVLGLIVAAIIAAVVVVHTGWFHNYVRGRIVSAVESATGGKADVKNFSFEWRTLTATINGFVIHGNEPAGEPPLLEVPRIVVRFRVRPSFNNPVDFRYVEVDQPHANVIALKNGQTNLPVRNTQSAQGGQAKSGQSASPLQKFVNLAIDNIRVRDGTIHFLDREYPLNIQGSDLLVDLAYKDASSQYQGNISLGRLYIARAGNEGVVAKVEIPIQIGSDAVQISNARFQSADSTMTASIALRHLANPELSGQISAHVGLDEVARIVSLPSYSAGGPGPQQVEVALSGRIGPNAAYIQTASVDLGKTHITSSGDLRSGASFQGDISLDQLGTVFKIPDHPAGVVSIAGIAKLPQRASYVITGHVSSKDISLNTGPSRLHGIRVNSSFRADPQTVAVDDFTVQVLGGRVVTNARVNQFKTFVLSSELRNFALRGVMSALGSARVSYAGLISGTVEANGGLALRDMNARASLSITPGRSGIPISGAIRGRYQGQKDVLSLGKSYLQLPNSRITFTGDLGKQIQIAATSRNFNDFLPVVEIVSPKTASMPLNVRRGGSGTFVVDARGQIANPHLSGHFAMARFSAQGRDFDRLAADFQASRSGVSLQNGVLAGSGSQAHFSTSFGLVNWKFSKRAPLNATASVSSSDVSALMALAGKGQIPVNGALNAGVNVSGTFGDPRGDAHVTISQGMAYGHPFDKVDAGIALSDQRANLTSLEIAAPGAALQLTADFTHPRDDFTSGRVQAHLVNSRVDLTNVEIIQAKWPGLAGAISARGDLVGQLRYSQGIHFAPSVIDANVNGSGIRDRQHIYGGFTANAATYGSDVITQVNSNVGGSAIQLASRTQLAPGYRSAIDGSIRNLPVGTVLSVVMANPPFAGNLSADLSANGTLNDPHANISFDLSRGHIYNEPVDRVNGSIAYTNQLLNISSLEAKSPAGSLELHGSFAHAPSNFQSGRLDLSTSISSLNLQKIHALENIEPGLGGSLRLSAAVSADLSRAGGGISVMPSNVDIHAEANRIALGGNVLGNLRLDGQTRGHVLSMDLDSSLAGSSIHGTGHVQLAAGYPADGTLAFSDLSYAGLRAFIPEPSVPADFNAVAEGQASFRGPLTNPGDAQAQLRLSKFVVSSKNLSLQNEKPVIARLEQSLIHIDDAQLSGPSIHIAVNGTAALRKSGPLNLSINAGTDLAVLKTFSKDAYASGSIAIQTSVQGTIAQPLMNGQIILDNASVQLTSWPNGIFNANGTIALNGSTARIQSLTAESGGGHVELTGFASLNAGIATYDLRANAAKVRTRYSGASITADAAITLTGTSKQSVLGGTVTIDRVGYSQQSDIGSILSASTTLPHAARAAPGPIRLNLRVQTAPDVRFQTNLAQELSASANLNVYGAPASPGIVGRIDITGGTLIFFGNKYTVNRGVISFFDPAEIAPVLDVDLQTLVQGVDVNLGVEGPIHNLKLTYRSDPPLKFEDIVALLATGKTPPDPTIAVNQPFNPSQSAAQIGESALLAQAVANPLANRLERVFGVSQIKIAPSFVAGSSLPQARVTIQQQVSGGITLTYSQDLAEANSELIRIEWAMTPRFSAVATRDENGIFGVDFFYKKQFR